MLRTIINLFPTWFLFFLFAAVFVGFAIFLHLMAQRVWPSLALKGIARSDFMFTLLATTNAILWGFTLIILWQTYITAKDNVSQESGELTKILIDSKEFPEPFAKNVVQHLTSYVKAVREIEWDLMREGKSSKQATRELELLYDVIVAYRPQTASQTLHYTDLLAAFDKALEARRSRIEKLTSIMPSQIYGLIWIDALALVILNSLIPERRKNLSIISIVFISATVGVNVALISAVDFPFAGEIAVSSKPFYLEDYSNL